MEDEVAAKVLLSPWSEGRVFGGCYNDLTSCSIPVRNSKVSLAPGGHLRTAETLFCVKRNNDTLRLQHLTGKEYVANLHLFTERTNPLPTALNLHPWGAGSWQKTRGRYNPIVSRDIVENKLLVIVSENKVGESSRHLCLLISTDG